MKQGIVRLSIKALIIVLIIRPLIWLLLGVNRYSRLPVPTSGPLIIAPNHNSHLDTLLLYAILPLKVALRARFVAAGDHFGNIPIFSWFLFDFCGMIPVWRAGKLKSEAEEVKGTGQEFLLHMAKALTEGDVLVLFPEGTRGLPEKRSRLRKGIAHLAVKFPDVPIYPVFISGLGKALPRDSFILIPLIPQIEIQAPILSKEKLENEVLGELESAYTAMEKKFAHKDRRVV